MPFSVVIPTYKRPETLIVAFKSVLATTLLPSEIIVIDDDTLTEEMLSEMRRLSSDVSVPFHYYKKGDTEIRRGLSESKNWAAELAKHDVVFFLDDDVDVDENYFKEAMKVWEEHWEDKKFIGLAGHVLNNRKQSWVEKEVFNRIFGLTGEHRWDVNDVGFQVWDNKVSVVEKAFYMHGCSSSYRRKALLELPFATFSGGRTALEDVAHGLSAKSKGYYFLYVPEAKMMHYQAVVGREAAFLAGEKESRNRKEIFKEHCSNDLKHKLWFYWANVGWIVKKLLALKFREAGGMIAGLLKPNSFAAVDLSEIFKGNTVDIYDSTGPVAEAVHKMNAGKVRLFSRNDSDTVEGITVSKFLAASAAGMTNADVCVLDGSALKVLAVRYPSDSRYVLARAALRGGWLIGLPGLLRRVILGRVRLGGIRTLIDRNGRRSYWLVVDRTHKNGKNERLFVLRGSGVQDFLDWLRSENIDYVVPRFYEALPKLHREDGDLDVLVSNEDAPKVEEYIRSNMKNFSGSNADIAPIGLHTVSRGSGVPYYPPPIARQILASAVDGPAHSRIPAPKEALLSFMYHCLYHHKGYSTGIPTNLTGRPEHPPENDYGAEVQRLASIEDVVVGETMEEMDEYLAKQGWRPKRDTLAKIAEGNMWVRDRFFGKHTVGTTGLTVYILKERVLERGLVKDIEHTLKDNGLKIMRTITLSDEQKERAAEHIRGGNWVDENGKSEGLLPAAILVAIDLQCANLPRAYAGEYERICAKQHKKQLREAIDEIGAPSLVHAADNTQEAWDYIEASVPNEMESIREEVERLAKAPLFVRLRRFVSPTYVIHTLHSRLRDFIARQLS